MNAVALRFYMYQPRKQGKVCCSNGWLAALWLGLALVATLLSIWLGIATAMSEIVIGTVAQLLPSKSSTTPTAGRPTTSCWDTAERTRSGAG